jgi:hypothetical protein
LGNNTSFFVKGNVMNGHIGSGVRLTPQPKFRVSTSPLPQGVILRRSPECAYNEAIQRLRADLMRRGFIYAEDNIAYPLDDYGFQ